LDSETLPLKLMKLMRSKTSCVCVCFYTHTHTHIYKLYTIGFSRICKLTNIRYVFMGSYPHARVEGE